MMATDVQTCLVSRARRRAVRACGINPLWNHYKASDGKWFHLVMLQADRYWPEFCTVIGRPDLAADERYADVVSRARTASN